MGRILQLEDFRRMNLPPHLRAARIGCVSEEVRKIIINYAKNIHEMKSSGAGFVFYGDCGAGKSSIASLVLRAARSRGYTAYFTGIWEYRYNILEREKFENECLISSRVRDVDFLVLDNLSEEDLKSRFLDIHEIIQLIKHRRMWSRPTIITTSLTLKNLSHPRWKGLVTNSKDWLIPVGVFGTSPSADNIVTNRLKLLK